MSPFKRILMVSTSAFCFGVIPTIASADPISALLTVAFAAASTFGVPFLGIAGGAIAGFGLVGSFLIRASLGLALSALGGSLKPKVATAGASSTSALGSRGYTVHTVRIGTRSSNNIRENEDRRYSHLRRYDRDG